jgi:hypothetical protein
MNTQPPSRTEVQDFAWAQRLPYRFLPFKRMRWAGHVAHMEDDKCIHLVRNRTEKYVGDLGTGGKKTLKRSENRMSGF